MAPTLTGRVVRTDAKVCHVQIEGETLLAAPRGALFENLGHQKNPIAVGDFVEIETSGSPASIEKVLERRNYLGRTASSHDPREQVLVANVDQLLIVGSLNKPGFSSNRTDRILAACVWHEIPATLILNKIDLARSGELEEVRATYERIPIPVLETCATKGLGLESLKAALQNKVSVFYGASGAGKSTLLNALQPGLKIKVGKISRYWDQGKHTTSFSRLHTLDFGGYVIDTPGIRVFRLHDLTRAELRDLYPEFSRYQSDCQFPDCSHDHEPRCAVFDAVDRGEIPASRYASYTEMLDEVSTDPIEDELVEPEEDPSAS